MAQWNTFANEDIIISPRLIDLLFDRYNVNSLLGRGSLQLSYPFLARTEAHTERLAVALADKLGVGAVLALDGDLGAGKTRFAQSLAQALGVKEPVNSPTFAIIKEYEGRRMPLYHMDLYRVTAAEADALGLDEYFYGTGVCVVEWASRITDSLPEERLDIHIAVCGETERLFALVPHGNTNVSICMSLLGEGVLQNA